MIVGSISVDDMQDTVEASINGGDAHTARTDALVHVSWLVTGTKTPEELSDIQDEIVADGASTEYRNSYQDAWRSLYNLIF
jgi:hypothetical protein